MKHFSFTDWADFVNGVSSVELIEAMRNHLDGGCGKCRKLQAACHSLRSLARRTAAYEPPDNTVQAAKSAFLEQTPHIRRSRITEMAELVFDSLRGASPVGVRGVETAEPQNRKLLYRKGTVQIDLSVESLLATNNLQIDGQALDSALPGAVISSAAVFLMSGKTKLAEGKTNSLGEFHLECVARKKLELCVWVSPDRELNLPLEQCVAAGSRQNRTRTL